MHHTRAHVHVHVYVQVSAARDIYQRGVWASRNERATTSLWTAWALLEERAGNINAARAYLRESLRRDRFAVDVRAPLAGRGRPIGPDPAALATTWLPRLPHER